MNVGRFSSIGIRRGFDALNLVFALVIGFEPASTVAVPPGIAVVVFGTYFGIFPCGIGMVKIHEYVSCGGFAIR
jgi:hypothetical protein